jgi:hypothetical protein
MLTSGPVENFDSLPEFRRACFAVISLPEASILAVFHEGQTLSVFYTETKPDCVIKKLALCAPSVKPERLSSLFECIQQDKALIAVALSDRNAVVAVPASMLQQNSAHITANDILARKKTSVSVHDVKIMPYWLVEEMGSDITLPAMQAAILQSSGKGREMAFGVALRPPPQGNSYLVHATT